MLIDHLDLSNGATCEVTAMPPEQVFYSPYVPGCLILTLIVVLGFTNLSAGIPSSMMTRYDEKFRGSGSTAYPGGEG